MTAQKDQAERAAMETLLKAVGAARSADPGAPTVDMDWSSPCRYSRAQLGRLEDSGRRLAGKLSQSLGGLLNCTLAVELEGLTQQYQRQLPQAMAGTYRAALAGEGGADCGFVALAAQTALTWVGQLLGIAASAGKAERELSSLELSLLLDIVARIVEPLSSLLAGAGASPVQPGTQVVREWPSAGGVEEYCRFAFRLDASQKDPAVFVVLPSSLMDGLADGGAKSAAATSPKETSKHMLAYVESASIEGQVWLGSGAVPMKDLVALESGDIVLIQRRVDEPIEFTVQGRVMLLGYLTQADGNYALQVVRQGEAPKES